MHILLMFYGKFTSRELPLFGARKRWTPSELLLNIVRTFYKFANLLFSAKLIYNTVVAFNTGSFVFNIVTKITE